MWPPRATRSAPPDTGSHGESQRAASKGRNQMVPVKTRGAEIQGKRDRERKAASFITASLKIKESPRLGDNKLLIRSFYLLIFTCQCP